MGDSDEVTTSCKNSAATLNFLSLNSIQKANRLAHTTKNLEHTRTDHRSNDGYPPATTVPLRFPEWPDRDYPRTIDTSNVVFPAHNYHRLEELAWSSSKRRLHHQNTKSRHETPPDCKPTRPTSISNLACRDCLGKLAIVDTIVCG
jgi:hypothetical protein